MEKEEYMRRAKQLGYTDEMIQGDIELYEKAKKDGVKIEYESFLVELPIND